MAGAKSASIHSGQASGMAASALIARLADALGRPEGTVRQWARGAVQVQQDVARWLEAAARWHERHPPPRR